MKLGFAFLLLFAATCSAVNITIASTTTHAIPTTLYGYMWEGTRQLAKSQTSVYSPHRAQTLTTVVTEDSMPNYSRIAHSKMVEGALVVFTWNSDTLFILYVFRTTAWKNLNGVTLAATTTGGGVSPALPSSLQVSVASGTTGAVAFANTGFWGMCFVHSYFQVFSYPPF